MKIKVNCPHCGVELTDPTHEVNGDKGIKVLIRTDENEGIIWLSHRFGNLKIDSGDIIIKERAIVEFFCPECKERISRNGKEGVKKHSCEECEAPMVHFVVTMFAEVCSRRGCDGVKIGGEGAPMNMNDIGMGSYFW